MAIEGLKNEVIYTKNQFERINFNPFFSTDVKFIWVPHQNTVEDNLNSHID